MSAIRVLEQDATSEAFLKLDRHPYLISDYTQLQNPETSLLVCPLFPITCSQVIILSPASISLRSEPPTSKFRSRLPPSKHANSQIYKRPQLSRLDR